MSIKGQNILEEDPSVASNNVPKFSGELYVKNVHKSFGVTKALNDVCFTGYFGEIHAVIGGNGSGKSTLAKVLAGVLPIDSGKVSVNGEHPSTPKESRDLGLAMVFQEVLVSDESSVVDNLFIGTDGFFTKTMSDNEKQNKARALMSELADEEIDPLAPAGNLPLSTKAWITITRALLSEPKVLILDESSAALDFDSTERLFKKMRELRDKGTAIIIVSHRIAELVRISDRCTVMRDGKDVGVLEKQDINEENLLRLMTGQEQTKNTNGDGAHKTLSTQISLKTKNMQVWPESDKSDFELLKGEIVGITGLDGHGQDDFVRILAGVARASKGFTQVSINHGNDYFSIKSLEEAQKHEIAFVSGDRKREGILPNLSIKENLAISMYGNHSKVPGVRFIEWNAINDIVDWEVERLAIKTGPKENLITSLSGGNQQKVMLGRAFATHPKILVLLDPARGIDLQTKRDLYKQLRDFADAGYSVIYMSTELEEFIGFCSRVIVFRNGSIYETFKDGQINPDLILASMFGHVQDGDTNKTTNSLAEKNNEQSVETQTASKKQNNNDYDKLGVNVSKYNVSKYFKNESDTLGSNGNKGGEFSATDEENFKALRSLSESKYSRNKRSIIEEVNPSLTMSEYSDNDAKEFENLMTFKEQTNKGKHHSNKGKINEGYSDTDEQSFNKLTTLAGEKLNRKDFISNSIKQKKITKLEDPEKNSSDSDTFEYTEKDIQEFEKLMHKK